MRIVGGLKIYIDWFLENRYNQTNKLEFAGLKAIN